MTRYVTRFSIEAKADLRRIDRKHALNILHKLAELEQDPYGIGTVGLVDRDRQRRLRVGDHRVIYEINDGRLIVHVVEVGHRNRIYRG